MTPFALLTVLTGLLLVGSGLVKLRAAARADLGIPVLSLLEAAVGLVYFILPFAAPLLAPSTGVWFVVGGVGLVLASSVSMALRLRARRHERDSSEGARLVTHVKYLSGDDPQP